MLMSNSLRDLDKLRAQYKKAQDMVMGRVLQRPSDDPQRVVEAMDLTGAKLRFERTERTGQDSREWLGIAEEHLDAIIEQLIAARDLAVQAGGPGAKVGEARAGIIRGIENIREALLRELNTQYRGQYIFSGWRTTFKPDPLLPQQPFTDDPATGGVLYHGTSDEILRDIAPDLAVAINIPGDRLLQAGDFLKTLSDIKAALEEGNTEWVISTGLAELDRALDNVNQLRSELGVRYQTIERYETYAQQAILTIEDRLGKVTGGDLEVAVIQMTEARTAYETALVAFSRTLPTSLLDYML